MKETKRKQERNDTRQSGRMKDIFSSLFIPPSPLVHVPTQLLLNRHQEFSARFFFLLSPQTTASESFDYGVQGPLGMVDRRRATSRCRCSCARRALSSLRGSQAFFVRCSVKGENEMSCLIGYSKSSSKNSREEIAHCGTLPLQE